ncbi:MAG: hypothetical protein ACEQSB_04910 [Undibacterium sp.]
MAAQAVSLRTNIIHAIELLRSGAIDPYGTLFELECSGEDSPEMRLAREIYVEYVVTASDLALWRQSYLTHLSKNARAIDQRLLENELRGVIAQLRSGRIEAFAWFESALYLEDLEGARADTVMATEGVTLEEFCDWQRTFSKIPADRRIELETALNAFRSPNPTA